MRGTVALDGEPPEEREFSLISSARSNACSLGYDLTGAMKTGPFTTPRSEPVPGTSCGRHWLCCAVKKTVSARRSMGISAGNHGKCASLLPAASPSTESCMPWITKQPK